MIDGYTILIGREGRRALRLSHYSAVVVSPAVLISQLSSPYSFGLNVTGRRHRSAQMTRKGADELAAALTAGGIDAKVVRW